MARKESFLVYLEPEQLSAVREVSAKIDRPIAEIIREGIDLVLARYSRLSGITHGPVAGNEGSGCDKE